MRVLGRCRTALDGLIVTYTLKRSVRAKHVRFEVRPEDGLTVVIPRSFRADQVPYLLEQKGRWVMEKLSQIARPAPDNQKDGRRRLAYLGRRLEVVRSPGIASRNRVKLQKGKLLVHLREDSRLDDVLVIWLRGEAQTFLTRKSREFGDRMGLAFSKLIIRGQKTRWASCSPRGNISFNWKLMMAPEPVIEYVVIHELAHLREMNHTSSFWRIVAEHCPHWRDYRKWLRDHGSELAFP